MPTRREPRFHVKSTVKIAPVDQPDEASAAVLVDVSGSGMKLLCGRDFPAGSRIVIETEQHLVLTRVLNSQKRGSQFSLGVEKVRTMLKAPEASPAEGHRTLSAQEAGHPFSDQPGRPSSDSRSFSVHKADLEATDGRTVDAQTLELLTRDMEALDRLELNSRSAAAKDTARETKPMSRRSLGKFQAPDKSQQKKAKEKNTDGIEITSTEKNSDPPFAAAFPLRPAGASRPREMRISFPLEPQFGVAPSMVPTAGTLTPVSTMPNVTELPRMRLGWITPSSVAAALLGLIILTVYFGSSHPASSRVSAATVTPSTETPLTIPSVTETPGTSGGEKVSATAEEAPPASNSAVPAAARGSAAALAAVRRATVKVSGQNWVSACSDGKPIFAELLSGGNSRDIDFHGTALIRIGNADTAEIFVDGKTLGWLGAPGTVKIVEIGASGFRMFPPNILSGTECRLETAKAP